MAFNFDKLFPNASKNKQKELFDTYLYIILVEWGWDYETFLKTPYPVINSCMRVWNKIKKEEQKVNKKRK